ncbi:hypothetical protein M0D21_05335 [Aquimarina sp. D1M17]|uniref:hypothetical protein n=1 Tax=Aquimarina acroporae TaxID=2937283 RepID=UPI0020C11DDA|nr:hypothetical protein [Aquimarina acroporae]MCK8520977.1 hypothetical protein [Aquimarina acroporae]
MRTFIYILTALFMTISLASCSTDSIADEDVSFEEYGTQGSDGSYEEEDEG